MKKLNKYLISAFTIIFFLGCQKLINVENPSDSSSLNDNKPGDMSVSLSDALNVSKSYFENVFEMSNKKNGRVGGDTLLANVKNKKLKDSKIYKDDKSNEDLFYLFRYEGGGFSIISADKRMTPVLAFSETNEFSNDDLDGVREWITVTKLAIRKVKKDLKEPNDSEKYLWKIYLKQSKNGRTSVTCPPDEWFDTGRYVDAVAQWGQSGEYKFYSPNDNGCSCQKKPAGCGAVAMAQIMRHHQHPQMTMTYNGSSMFTNYLTMDRNLPGVIIRLWFAPCQ